MSPTILVAIRQPHRMADETETQRVLAHCLGGPALSEVGGCSQVGLVPETVRRDSCAYAQKGLLGHFWGHKEKGHRCRIWGWVRRWGSRASALKEKAVSLNLCWEQRGPSTQAPQPGWCPLSHLSKSVPFNLYQQYIFLRTTSMAYGGS